MASVVAAPGEKVVIQDIATTAADGLIIIPSPSINYHTITLQTSNATASAGKVKVESAATDDYGGTWVLEVTEVTLAQYTAINATFTGARGAIRARISTTLTGGVTLTAYYMGV